MRGGSPLTSDRQLARRHALQGSTPRLLRRPAFHVPLAPIPPAVHPRACCAQPGPTSRHLGYRVASAVVRDYTPALVARHRALLVRRAIGAQVPDRGAAQHVSGGSMRLQGRRCAFRAAPALTQRLGLVHVQAALLVNTDPQRGLQAAQVALEAAIVHR